MATQVYFVSAGPGDPELLTLKAKRILESVDVIVYADSLVPRQILQYAKVNCQIHESASMELEQFMEIIVKAVKEGKTVARVHSGDTSVYSAIQEQIDILQENGVSFEVIPGVGSYQAMAAILKREFTIPEVVQTIILSRASGRTKVPLKEELAALAKHQATICLYLSAMLAQKIQQDLLTAYPPDTPVAIGYRVSWPDQKMIQGQLKDLAQLVKEAKISRSALIVVSPALADHRTRSKLYDKTFSHIFRRSNFAQTPGKGR